MYGCTRFQPSLPPEETEDTEESERQKLEGIYSQDGINGADRAEGKHLMETTFYLQRCHINALPAPTLEKLRTKWPYIFTQKGLYAHFELLTDIPLLRRLELAMEECGRAIVKCFSDKTDQCRSHGSSFSARGCRAFISCHPTSDGSLLREHDRANPSCKVKFSFYMKSTRTYAIVYNDLSYQECTLYFAFYVGMCHNS